MSFSLLYENCPEAFLSTGAAEEVYQLLSFDNMSDPEGLHNTLVSLVTTDADHSFRFYDYIARIFGFWTVGFADLHFDCSQLSKPVASSALPAFLQKVATVALALADAFIQQASKTTLDHANRLDQAVFVFQNVKYSPNSITDSPLQFDSQWRFKDAVGAGAHTTFCALIETLSDDQLHAICERAPEVGMMPTLAMIFAAARGRGCKLLSKPEMRRHLSFGIALDTTSNQEVFCSPLFLLLRPFWRLSDLDDELAAKKLAEAFADALVPRMLMRRDDVPGIGHDEVSDAFVARYLLSVPCLGCSAFDSLCRDVAPLLERHMQQELGPPPSFVRCADFRAASKASTAFRNDVLAAVAHGRKTGVIGNCKKGELSCMFLSFFATAASPYAFARVLTHHNTAASNDNITIAIRYEDALRQSLYHVRDRSELSIYYPTHSSLASAVSAVSAVSGTSGTLPNPHNPHSPHSPHSPHASSTAGCTPSFVDLVRASTFIDSTSSGLCAGIVEGTLPVLGRIDFEKSRYGVSTCILIRGGVGTAHQSTNPST